MQIAGQHIPPEILSMILASSDSALSVARFRATCKHATQISAVYRNETMTLPAYHNGIILDIPRLPVFCKKLHINAFTCHIPDTITAEIVSLNASIARFGTEERTGLTRVLQKATSVVMQGPGGMTSHDTSSVYPSITSISGHVGLHHTANLFPNLQDCYVYDENVCAGCIETFRGRVLYLIRCSLPTRFTFHGEKLVCIGCGLNTLSNVMMLRVHFTKRAEFTYVCKKWTFLQWLECSGSLASLHVSFANLKTRVSFVEVDNFVAHQAVLDSGTAHSGLLDNCNEGDINIPGLTPESMQIADLKRGSVVIDPQVPADLRFWE